MDKRDFLKTSGLLLAGGMLSQISGQEQAGARKNWAGNYQYRAGHLAAPASVSELQSLVRSCDKVKALGARHSFNSIADTAGTQVSLKNFQQIALDPKSRTVAVGAGIRYGQLAPHLDQAGFALHNLASLPHITVAGACATGTHGSGNANGNLSTAVAALDLITASGEHVRLSRDRDGEQFRLAVLSLGALGIVTGLTLDVQPAYQMTQTVYENLSFDQFGKHFDDIFGSGYSVSLFTDWQNHRATQVWIKRRYDPAAPVTPAPKLFDATLATRKLHPLAGHSAENCTEQLNIPGPWYERLPHFRMNFTPSSGDELQSEYFVPRSHGYQAVLAVEKLRDHITPHLMISELRTVEGDSLCMSPCYERPAMTIHFTWKPDWPAVKTVLPLIEQALAPFQVRPHWAKLFTLDPASIQNQYKKLPEFRQTIEHFDPQGKFQNDFLRGTLSA